MFCNRTIHGIKLIKVFCVLLSNIAFAQNRDHGFKGEYILQRAVYGDAVCKTFKDNLNQFRKLDFDVCHPRISTNFPQFSRPYAWREISFDLALAETAIKSPTFWGQDAASNAYHQKNAQRLWELWLKGTEEIRRSGNARMWLTEIDIDGDGYPELILRLDPGARVGFDPTRAAFYQCDEDRGELYVIRSGQARTAVDFNTFAGVAGDIVFDSSTNLFYLLEWRRRQAARFGTAYLSEQGPMPDIGGTRGTLIKTLSSPFTPGANLCVIDWVREGHYQSPLKQK